MSHLQKKLEKDQEKYVKACNIDRDKPKPRKDIFNFAMMEKYFDYIFEKPQKSELDECDNEKFNEFVKEYAKDFKLTTKDEWFYGVKKVAEKLGYCTDNKLYKQNPDSYKGNTAKVCELLRLAITGYKNSPDLYEIMLALGEEEVKNRLKQA